MTTMPTYCDLIAHPSETLTQQLKTDTQKRREQIKHGITQGKTPSQIANDMHIPVNGVKACIDEIMEEILTPTEIRNMQYLDIMPCKIGNNKKPNEEPASRLTPEVLEFINILNALRTEQ